MHGVHHALPPYQRVIPIKAGNIVLVCRSRMADDRSLGEDQANLVPGPTAVIGNDLVRWHPAGGMAARHGRHDDAILQAQLAQGEGLEQRA